MFFPAFVVLGFGVLQALGTAPADRGQNCLLLTSRAGAALPMGIAIARGITFEESAD
jgi:hypothetical protein